MVAIKMIAAGAGIYAGFFAFLTTVFSAFGPAVAKGPGPVLKLVLALL
jgi:hypothetical protein